MLLNIGITYQSLKTRGVQVMASGSQNGDDAIDLQDRAIRVLITEVMRSSRKSREQIAEEMSRLAGVSITVSMLNDYAAESKKQTRFPASFTAAFCTATQDDRLRKLLLGAHLRQVLAVGESRLETERAIRPLLRSLLFEDVVDESLSRNPAR
jgi:hypothetical protein